MTTVVVSVISAILESVAVVRTSDRVGAGIGTGSGTDAGVGAGAGVVVFGLKVVIGLVMV